MDLFDSFCSVFWQRVCFFYLKIFFTFGHKCVIISKVLYHFAQFFGIFKIFLNTAITFWKILALKCKYSKHLLGFWNFSENLSFFDVAMDNFDLQLIVPCHLTPRSDPLTRSFHSNAGSFRLQTSSTIGTQNFIYHCPGSFDRSFWIISFPAKSFPSKN